MAVWLPGMVAVVFSVLLSLGSAVAADYSASDMHRGEQFYDEALLGVENVDERWLLNFDRQKPAILPDNFTMSYCGKELAPTGANLTAMIGKPCRSWSMAVEHKMLVYHRLEFQCR
jgi:hypothetical protein